LVGDFCVVEVCAVEFGGLFDLLVVGECGGSVVGIGGGLFGFGGFFGFGFGGEGSIWY